METVPGEELTARVEISRPGRRTGGRGEGRLGTPSLLCAWTEWGLAGSTLMLLAALSVSTLPEYLRRPSLARLLLGALLG